MLNIYRCIKIYIKKKIFLKIIIIIIKITSFFEETIVDPIELFPIVVELIIFEGFNILSDFLLDAVFIFSI
jgi:hypothetical protein